MPATNAWNEAKPAGSDLASSLDDQIRQFKLDVRERLALSMIWNVSVEDDGKIKSLPFKPADNSSWVTTDTAPSLTGANAQFAFNLAQTWNTTGAPTFFNVNITDTASAGGSNLFNFRVGGVSRLSLRKDGRLDVPGTSFFTGAASFNSAAFTTGSFNAANPAANLTNDLGTTVLRWRRAYLGQVVPSVVIAPNITGNTNNWTFAGLSTASVIMMNATGAFNLTGITSTGFEAGQTLILCAEVGSSGIVLQHEDGFSTDSNRFFTRDGGPRTITQVQCRTIIRNPSLNNRWLFVDD